MLSMFSTLCIVYLEPVINKYAALLQEIGDNWNGWFILLVYLVIFLAAGAFLKIVGGFRFKDFDVIYSYRNLPTWYAALLGICVYPVLSFYLNTSPLLDKPSFKWNIIAWVSLLIVGSIIGELWRFCSQWCKQKESAKPKNQTTLDELSKNPEKLVKWLQKEKPIDISDEDFFGSIVIADRIVRTLTKRPFKTISLIGPYGSGKTSILNLAQEKLKKKGKIVISISAWGYEEKKLTGYILRNIVRQISKYTDCLNTYLVPLKFQSIFLNNSWGVFNFLKFLFILESPGSLIRKINEVLKRADKELIIFLEDIDRNQSEDITHQLYSLFNYFVDMDNICFIVTYGSDNVVAEPLTKITDKTEVVPKSSWFTTFDLLVKLRGYCLDKYNDIYVPGFNRQVIDKQIGVPEDVSYQYYRVRRYAHVSLRGGTKLYEPSDCLVELLRYPRYLKRALAHTYTTWQQLHGEIYFDDLLVINTIRTTACSLFHLIVNNIDRFRIFNGSNQKANNKELYQQVEKALDTDKVLDKMLYHELIQFLFPGWQIVSEDQSSKLARSVYATLHPQGIATDSNVDYFARVFAEELPEGQLSDQAVMQSLSDYDSDKYSATEFIAKIMISKQFAERVEYFGKMLKPAKVLALTSEYFKTIANNDIELKRDELDGRLWRMSLDNYETEENHKRWLEHQIDSYLSKSLRFTNDIFYLWGYRTRSDSQIKQYPPELCELYIEKIKQLVQKPEQFVKALEYDLPHIWTLSHLIDVTKQMEKTVWQPWLVDSLIKASQQSASIVAMYAVPLMYKLNDEVVKPEKLRLIQKAGFDEARGTELFDNDLPKLMKVVSILKEDDYKNYSDLDEQAKILLDYAVTHSKQWLQDNSS